MERLIERIKPITDEEIIRSMPKAVKVRNHLIRYGSITENEGRDLYGIGRVAPIIERLRHKREPLMVIETVMEDGCDRCGGETRYARWYFKGFVEDKSC